MSAKELKKKIKEIKNKPKFRDFGSFFGKFPEQVTGQDLFNKTQEIIKNHPASNYARNFDVASKDISKMNINMFPADYITFDSNTNFPNKDKLPEGFNAEKIMEEQKTPGLDIKKLHEQGITGKGINIAIIDQPLSKHQEYSGKIKHYEEIGLEKIPYDKSSMHGPFVTSLAIGEKCGSAPKAECYYFATNFVDREMKQSSIQIIKCLEKIIELNNGLSKKDKIQIVSISGCFKPEHEGYEDWLKTVEKAKASGLDVLTADLDRDYGLNFNGMQRDITESPDNIDSYSPITNKIDGRFEAKSPEKSLLFPCDHRTGASHQGDDKYFHTSRGGISWIVPHVAGLYALAKQVDSSCTLEHLWEVGLKTGEKKEDFNGIIANPVKMIKTIEYEKTLKNLNVNNIQKE